jgi:hypothetical protein
MRVTNMRIMATRRLLDCFIQNRLSRRIFWQNLHWPFSFFPHRWFMLATTTTTLSQVRHGKADT